MALYEKEVSQKVIPQNHFLLPLFFGGGGVGILIDVGLTLLWPDGLGEYEAGLGVTGRFGTLLFLITHFLLWDIVLYSKINLRIFLRCFV